MKLLKLITNQNFNMPVEVEKGRIPRTREAARAILIDKAYRIALLFVSKENYYKLPGGGLEENETITEALEREILEETGCRAQIMTEIGEVQEKRENWLITQKSYCFSAKVIGEKGRPVFTEEEIADGFELKWTEIDEAIKLVKSTKPIGYQGNFVQLRDLTFLREFAKQIELNG